MAGTEEKKSNGLSDEVDTYRLTVQKKGNAKMQRLLVLRVCSSSVLKGL
jgi:hypothetical protein